MEKINIAELLKDCPKGMELDCTMFNNVTFDKVEADLNARFPICIKVGIDDTQHLTKHGDWRYGDINSKCVIFPKGKTTWEGFVPPCKFKNGDIITCGWNEKSISYSWTCILAEAPEKVIDNYFINDYCSLDCNGGFLPYNSEADSATWVRFATEEEKEKLFQAIKNSGYKMKRYEVLFADLDGTLIETISGETFPKGVWDMKIKFDVLDKIKELNPKYLLIVTNQGGIEKGFIDEFKFRHKLEYICSSIKEYCGCKNVFSRYCVSNCKTDPNRKPNTGMLEYLTETFIGDDFDYIKSKSLMIGDASGKEGQFSDSDKKCAENFNIDYLDVNDFINKK